MTELERANPRELKCRHCQNIYDIDDFPDVIAFDEYWYCSEWCFEQPTDPEQKETK